MEVEDLGHHISRRFNEDLERVRNAVLSMGGLVEEQLERAVKALSEGNSQLGLQVAEDDVKVNRMEVSIDEECSRILATRAPTAVEPARGRPRCIVASCCCRRRQGCREGIPVRCHANGTTARRRRAARRRDREREGDPHGLLGRRG